jgi:hypothetical protein
VCLIVQKGCKYMRNARIMIVDDEETKILAKEVEHVEYPY